jgi:YYY domain-containing protein
MFSLVLALTKKYTWPIIAVIQTGFSSNINHLIFFLGLSQKKEETFFWWASSSRVIGNTINEFPFYSFVLGDLHAHYLGLLFIPTILILIFLINNHNKKIILFLLGLALAVAFMTNAWDYVIYLPLAFLVKFIWDNFSWPPSTKKTALEIYSRMIPMLITLATSGVFVAMFFYAFKNCSEGFHIVDSDKSSFRDFLILFPLQILISFFYLVQNFSNTPNKSIVFTLTAAASIAASFTPLGILPFITFLSIYSLFLIFKLEPRSNNRFSAILMFFSFILIIFCELVYLKDIYGQDYQRTNTVFKFYYQFWVLSSIWMTYFVYKISQNKDWISRVFLVIYFLILSVNISYIYWGFKQSAGDFSQKPTLNGIRFIQENNPDKHESILWIRDNISGQKVIAEKPGTSFTEDSRISTFTGNLTPLGWHNHEWVWRGNKQLEKISERKTDMDNLFSATDIEIAKSIIKKYQINYIYLGSDEKAAYTINSDSILYKLGDIIFQKGSSELVKISSN